MKTHKNKKLYNFTAKQKARRRTRATLNHWQHNAPKRFRNPFNREFRAKCRRSMTDVRQYLQQNWPNEFWWYENQFFQVPDNFPVFVKNVNYWYW